MPSTVDLAGINVRELFDDHVALMDREQVLAWFVGRAMLAISEPTEGKTAQTIALALQPDLMAIGATQRVAARCTPTCDETCACYEPTEFGRDALRLGAQSWDEFNVVDEDAV